MLILIFVVACSLVGFTLLVLVVVLQSVNLFNHGLGLQSHKLYMYTETSVGIILQEGSTLMIDCTLTSMATLVWSRDGVTLLITSPILVIAGANESDSGTYACTAFGITRQVPVYILPGTISLA